MAALAAASMVIGNLVAIGQSNIRRLFGYSTIAHAGYILVGVAAGVKTSGVEAGVPQFLSVGPDSVLFYLGAYAAANLTAFFAIIAIGKPHRQRPASTTTPASPAGLPCWRRRWPWPCSLDRSAPTSIFIGKLYIFTAAVKADLAWLAILGVINSVVSAYYYVRIIRVMFLQAPPVEGRLSAPPASWAALGVAGAAVLFMGIAPGYVLELSRSAVGPLVP